MSLEKLKLSKPLLATMMELGYLNAKEIQSKTMLRIQGGQDVIAVGPDGCGKTTTYVLATLMRIKYGFEEAPRALILVPTKERLQQVMEQFSLINRNKTIRIVAVHNDENIERQIEDITDGCDIVVALPNRARAIYLKLGLNVNKLQLFVVDDASEMVKQGLQLPVNELAASAQKCQHLVFSDVMHERIEKMINAFMRMPAYIEVEDLGSEQLETHTQVIYHVPNFRTKLNLLNLLLGDKEVFDKAIVLVNTRLTAQTIAKDLFNGKADDVFVLKPLFFDDKGFDTLETFKADENARVLIVAHEVLATIDFAGIPFIFQFDFPDDQQLYLQRIIKKGSQQDFVFLTLINDLELPAIKKVEQAIGKRLNFEALPAGLHFDDSAKKIDTKREKAKKEREQEEAFRALAFQPKKESNAKTTNIGAGKKAKMDKIRKHS